MSDLYYEDFFEGMRDALSKQGSDLFSSPNNASMFPTSSAQAKWRFAKGQNFLRLHDGQKVYSFSLPSGFGSEGEFAAHREPDHEHTKFEEGADQKGLAQVHRSDPGSIYFTLQEGRDNPTYTFKHVGESNWRGVPKKRKAREAVIPNVNIPAVAEGVKAAFSKKAEVSPFKWAAGSGVRGLQRTLQAPGEAAFRLGGNGESPVLGALGTAALGAGAGGLYHLGKRHLYNTPEENAEEDEQGSKPLLRRTMLPAALAGLLGGGQASLFQDRYRDLTSGAGAATTMN